MYPVFTIGTGSAGSLQSLHIDSVTGPLSYNPSSSTLSCSRINISGLITSSYSTEAVSGELGYVNSVSFTTQTVTNNTFNNLGSITLDAGMWLVIFKVHSSRTNAYYYGFSAEISTSSTAYDYNNSFIQQTFTSSAIDTQTAIYNTRMYFYSATSFTLYGNGIFYFTGTAVATGIMQATRIA